MFTPQSTTVALLLIVVSMLCWGSWPNLLKALPEWRLEYFYVDYTIGFLLTVILISATAGSPGPVGFEFVDRLLSADPGRTTLAFIGGLVWNAGNILLLNSIMIAGLAVAFTIGSVLAITLGVGISYWAQPIGQPVWLLAGCAVLIVAAIANAQAYRRPGQTPAASKPLGIALSLAAGVLIGVFPPFIGAAISGNGGLDPYVVSIVFMIGAALATLIGVPLLLARPFIGTRASIGGYLQGTTRWHVFGLLAGAIWCIGTVSNFASAGLVGVAVSWGIGSGAPMVGALWGIFLWHEFRGADRRAHTLIAASLTLYTIGVVLVAIAYQQR
jgi:glucose uptake protein